jgi:hypothetical protein
MDLTSINAIRTLSMDAVQAVNSSFASHPLFALHLRLRSSSQVRVERCATIGRRAHSSSFRSDRDCRIEEQGVYAVIDPQDSLAVRKRLLDDSGCHRRWIVNSHVSFCLSIPA